MGEFPWPQVALTNYQRRNTIVKTERAVTKPSIFSTINWFFPGCRERKSTREMSCPPFTQTHWCPSDTKDHPHWFRAGISDSSPPLSPPEPCRWRWRSQPAPTARRTGRLPASLLSLRRTPSRANTWTAWRARPQGRSSWSPSLNPNQQGRAWGPPSATGLDGRSRQWDEGS